MLTKDLLLFRTSKGRVRPSFVDPEKPELLELADELVTISKNALGEPKKDADEALMAAANGYKRPKIARGLVKLVQDRMTFEEPGEEAGELRNRAFAAARETLAELPADTAFVDYEARLNARLDGDLEGVRAGLYADLLEARALTAFDVLTAVALLHRYNLAQAQGLLVHARSIELRAVEADVVEMRRVLRHLKFCRLVAEMRKDKAQVVFHIEGPAALFESAKKYGLQLASFLSAVPILPRWALEATIEMPRRTPATLSLSHDDGLVSPFTTGLGHVPEEIAAVLGKLEVAPWEVELSPEPRAVGATGLSVPDVAFRHPAHKGEIAIELFHAWHAAVLTRRLDELASRPDPTLFLGVDRSLAKREELAPRLADHPQVFEFNAFPSVRAIKKILAAAEANA